MKGKLHKRRLFTPSVMADRAVNMATKFVITERPLVAPSLRSGCYSLGPSGLLKCVETLDSISNYYLEYTCNKCSNLIGQLGVHYFTYGPLERSSKQVYYWAAKGKEKMHSATVA